MENKSVKYKVFVKKYLHAILCQRDRKNNRKVSILQMLWIWQYLKGSVVLLNGPNSSFSYSSIIVCFA